MEQPATPSEDEIISDETFATMLDAMDGAGNDQNVEELLQAMNENRIISREEAEHILEIEGPNKVVKCGLPPTVRPSDPENTTDPEECVSRLLRDDPTLEEINLNNMKRTPIPVIQRMLLALKTNTHLKRLMLANVGLTDSGAEPFLEALAENTTLEQINIETNFLTGEFLAKLFNAALINMTIREIKAVNQSTTFGTDAEMLIMQAVNKNRGLTKVSVNLRHPEAKNKVEQACLRNGEIRRQLRRMEQLEQQREAVEKAEAQNNVAKVEEAKPSTNRYITKKTPAPVPTPAAPVKKEPETPKPAAAAGAEKEKPKEKVAEKKPTPAKPEAEKKPADKPAEKPAPKREWGKKPAEKPAVAEPPKPAPAPPPAPKVEAPKEEPPTASTAPKATSPKPTLAMAAKEAAAKAQARGFGQSDPTANSIGNSSISTTPKKKMSISERGKLFEDTKPIEPIVPPLQSTPKSTVSRPGTLSIGASKDVPHGSKGLGAATFGSAAPSSKVTTPSKPDPTKGRRGSGTMKTPTLSSTTPKSETAPKPWAKSSIGAGSKSTDVKSKADSSISESKPKTYGYGSSSIKKRDSIK